MYVLAFCCIAHAWCGVVGWVSELLENKFRWLFCCYPLFVIVSPRAYRLKCSIVFVTWHLASSVCGVRLLPVPWWLGRPIRMLPRLFMTPCAIPVC